jgi:hypothetical protein
VSGQRHALACLPPEKNAGPDRIGGWVDPRAYLDCFGEDKYLVSPGILTPDRPTRSQGTEAAALN